MKKIKILLVLILGIVLVTGCNIKPKTANKHTIMVTNFPCYDIARALTKDTNIEVKMLLKPGAEIHDFEPTPQDIINIQKSGMFIYVGGESDEWINDVLKDIDASSTKLIKLVDLVDLKEEEIVEGMEAEEEENEEEEEYDEHVWTSPINMITMINKIKDDVINLDSSNKDKINTNASNYIKELETIDSKIKEVVKTAKRKELIFGDRFPLRYFVDEYNIKYYAAFPGCSEQTEANAKTISYLINKVKKDKVPVVLKIELSTGNIANTIAKETNTKVLEFNTAHNITQDDFDKGITYIDIMNNNIEVLKEALN
ncbi:MAG: metal ABC transporter substrate-binding protein [Bacilli bacterium]|nr:metal ABC transporter substrate-binding protein [Bacilli bacterium]